MGLIESLHVTSFHSHLFSTIRSSFVIIIFGIFRHFCAATLISFIHQIQRGSRTFLQGGGARSSGLFCFGFSYCARLYRHFIIFKDKGIFLSSAAPALERCHDDQAEFVAYDSSCPCGSCRHACGCGLFTRLFKFPLDTTAATIQWSFVTFITIGSTTIARTWFPRHFTSDRTTPRNVWPTVHATQGRCDVVARWFVPRDTRRIPFQSFGTIGTS